MEAHRGRRSVPISDVNSLPLLAPFPLSHSRYIISKHFGCASEMHQQLDKRRVEERIFRALLDWPPVAEDFS